METARDEVAGDVEVLDTHAGACFQNSNFSPRVQSG